MPESHTPPQLPFKFTGGFALPTKSIGFILSVQGLIQMIVTIFIFPLVNRRLGSLVTFRLTALSYPVLYIVVPYLTLLPESWRPVGIYGILVWKVSAQAFTFPSLAIMLNNSAPSKRVLGTLNGVAASSASLCRTFGPTLSGALQSTGLGLGCLGLPWWANSLVALMGGMLSLCMVEERRRYTKIEQPGDTTTVSSPPYTDASDPEAGSLAGAGLYVDDNTDVEPLPIYDGQDLTRIDSK